MIDKPAFPEAVPTVAGIANGIVTVIMPNGTAKNFDKAEALQIPDLVGRDQVEASC